MTTVNIDIDKILSPEQRQELAQEIWKENEEAIRSGIRKALHHELQSDVVHRARSFLATELGTMIKTVIQDKLPEIEKTLHEIVTQLVGFDDTLLDALSEVTKEYLATFTETAGSRLSIALRTGINRALEKGQMRYFEARARKQRSEKLT